MVSSVDELPDCSSQNDGEQYVVEDKDKVYVCSEGEWADVDAVKNSSSNKQVYSSSTEKRGSSSSVKSSSGKISSSSEKYSSNVRTSSSSVRLSSSSVKLSSSSGMNSSSSVLSSSSADTGRKLIIKRILNSQVDYAKVTIQRLDSTLRRNAGWYYGGYSSLISGFVIDNLPLDLNYAEITLKGKLDGALELDENYYVSLVGVDTLYIYPGTWSLLKRAESLVFAEKISFEEAKFQAESEMQRAILGDVKFHNLEQINLEADKSDSAMWAKIFVNLLYYNSSCAYNFDSYKNTGKITVDPHGVAGIIDMRINGRWKYCMEETNRIFCDSIVYERLYPVYDSLSGRGKCTAEHDGEIVTLDFSCIGRGHDMCDNLEWREPTTYEYDTYQWEFPCTTPGYKLGNGSFNMYFCNTKGEWINSKKWSWDIDKDFVVNPDLEYGTLTDPRDGKVYKTYAAEGMVWMAQNLDFRGYVDKSLEVPGLVENMKGKYACYKDSAEYCDVCGTLYDIHAVLNIDGSIEMSNSNIVQEYIQRNHQGICPDGWHIPTQKEMNHFVSYSRPEYIASRFGWESDSFIGRFANQYGLSVMPCGYKEKGVFDGVGYETYIAVIDSPNVHLESILFNDNVSWNFDLNAYSHEDALVSVRCVKNK